MMEELAKFEGGCLIVVAAIVIFAMGFAIGFAVGRAYGVI
jgi:hypothetical protein